MDNKKIVHINNIQCHNWHRIGGNKRKRITIVCHKCGQKRIVYVQHIPENKKVLCSCWNCSNGDNVIWDIKN
jgi:hypothetical protein